MAFPSRNCSAPLAVADPAKTSRSALQSMPIRKTRRYLDRARSQAELARRSPEKGRQTRRFRDLRRTGRKLLTSAFPARHEILSSGQASSRTVLLCGALSRSAAPSTPCGGVQFRIPVPLGTFHRYASPHIPDCRTEVRPSGLLVPKSSKQHRKPSLALNP